MKGSYEDRLLRLRRKALKECEALLITHLPNIRYLVGFTGSSGVLVVTLREAVFFSAPLYRTQARHEIVGAELRVAAGEPLHTASQWLVRQHLRSVAYEPDRLAVAQLWRLERDLGRFAELRPSSFRVEQLRAIKERGEIGLLRAAVDLTARVFLEVLPLVRPGVRELDLAAEIDYRMKQQGAAGPAFETIVASGPRAALPHGRSGRKRLKKNELVIFDLGAILAGYCGDMTRTIFLGEPPVRVRRIYAAVERALQRARHVVRAGAEAWQVDRAARRYLVKSGWGKHFVHGTGHGLGLEVHEEPSVGRGSRARLEEGHVITLEPGVYLPGFGGVRIEDVVAVRRGGAETLTPLGTELICL